MRNETEVQRMHDLILAEEQLFESRNKLLPVDLDMILGVLCWVLDHPISPKAKLIEPLLKGIEAEDILSRVQLDDRANSH